MPRKKINVARAYQLRYGSRPPLVLSWRSIGIILAQEEGRQVVYQPDTVMKAVSRAMRTNKTSKKANQDNGIRQPTQRLITGGAPDLKLDEEERLPSSAAAPTVESSD